ncbi:MAG: DUF418 domain-containing protein [Ectothiorhodospiraceae bacterium]|nr:DUF418 domain-containing protein [Ectothiorhodospiraceae bacterium]
MQPRNGTSDPGDRIDSLDVLRGFAVLGILVMNIQAFAMISAAYINPTALGPLSGREWWVWLAAHLAFDGKFLAIFAALFGAGMVLMADRAARTGDSPWRRHRRRMGTLALIGAVHAYAVWYGDILLIYAVVGLLAFLFRNLAGRRLLVLAGVFYLVPVIWMLLMTGLLQIMPEAAYQEMANSYWRPDAQTVVAQEAAYRGAWLAQMQQRVPDALTLHLLVLPTEEGWRVLALMLAGMAGYKSGLLTGSWAIAGYRRLLLVGLAGGLPLVLTGVAYNQLGGWDMGRSMYLGAVFNHLATPLLALAWVAAAMLVLKHGLLPGLVARLRAVGRGALSAYLLSSVLCTLVFYGHGLGLFGQLDRLEQLLVVGAVWMLLLGIAPAWFRHFRMGPVEWLWRWSVYGVQPPLRRSLGNTAA